jgi:DNA-binding transcriptional MerR regulator
LNNGTPSFEQLYAFNRFDSLKDNMKGQYSIKDLERLSGIKAHTLRIWEKRYKIITPSRTDTNIRYYNNEELRKILNIAVLNNVGVKISRIVGMSADELHQKVIEVGNEQVEEGVQIDSLVVSMVEFDEDRFEKVLTNCTIRLGFERTFLKVIYPFFKKVGILWLAGAINPAQEHFISNLVRQKLVVAIDGQGIVKRTHGVQFLLFLPPGEMHELGLLFHNYLIQKAGLKVIYLGQSIPIQEVLHVDQYAPAQYIVTSALSVISTDELNKFLNDMLSAFPDKTIILASFVSSTEGLVQSPRLLVNQSPDDFKELLSDITGNKD